MNTVILPRKSSIERSSRSSYAKYKCQYQRKAILTKLTNDSGYPQDILNNVDSHSPEFNYLRENKKNLKNFFTDRIPPENMEFTRLLKKDQEILHPSRIHQIKKLQQELKNKTRMSLKGEFISEEKKLRIEKVDKNFLINDKNKELKEKYGGSKKSMCYDEQNFRRGTQSHIGKRSKVLKKQAYDKVFGPDISSLSRTFYLPQAEEEPSRKKSHSFTMSKQGPDHLKLRSLITRMHGYRNKLDENHQSMELVKGSFNNVGDPQQMMQLIQNMSKIYQGRSVTQGQHRIQYLEDISKIDKDYYRQMQMHKTQRLAQRHLFINHTLNPSRVVDEFDHQVHLPIQNESVLSCQSTTEQQIQILSLSMERHSVKNRFKLLKKTLVKWAGLSYIYGIQKNNIYMAFRSHRQPYELEGSYAFFKCLKLGDFRAVQVFIHQNPQYVFEVEFYGKTALSYACYHDQTEVALHILSVGVNSDLKCQNGRTSLYYALNAGNVTLVRALLQRGACPWSNASNPYQSMLANKPDQQLECLFHNARKVYLGMQIQRSINARKEFWAKYSPKITEDIRLEYNSNGHQLLQILRT